MVRLREVTDPEILKQLEGPSGLQEVTDPNILAQLEPSLSVGEMFTGALKNLPGDVAGVAKSIWSAVKQPSAVMEGLSDVGAGGIAKLLPEGAFKTTPEAQETRIRTEQAAGQFGEHYKERYGGIENIKRSIAEHPAETGLDLLTLRSIFRGPGKAAQPGKLAPETKAAVDLAAEKGLPLSPTAIIPESKAARAFEWVGESIPSNVSWSTMKRQQLQTGLTRMMDEAVGGLPARAEKYEAGVAVAGGLKEAKTGLKGAEKTAYGKWENALGSGGHLMDNTVAAIDKIKEGTKGEARAWLEAFSKKGSGWTSADVDAFQKQIWSKTWGTDLRGGDLLEAMKKDLGPEMTAVLDEAKDASKLFRAFAGNETVRAVLRKYNQDPANAIRAMFRDGNMNDIGTIQKAVKPEVWDIARSRFIENLFDASTDITGTQRTFNPQKFANLFSTYQRQIKQVMPEKYDYLKNFAELSKVSVADLSKMTSAPTFRLTAADRPITNTIALAVPTGFSWAITKSLMNPSGWLKKWLTEGFKMPNLATPARRANILQVGGREAVPQEAQQ